MREPNDYLVNLQLQLSSLANGLNMGGSRESAMDYAYKLSHELREYLNKYQSEKSNA